MADAPNLGLKPSKILLPPGDEGSSDRKAGMGDVFRGRVTRQLTGLLEVIDPTHQEEPAK